ncbi:P-loop containing nucleoside triphosphate hydrolase protein [Massariosphaeria phaeospora]|uniref:P-loop containing nucleoside triphosphate hydrolase protein n=1 Tax=Massariosphaeria phaeospora TaxID=100035 RepID=A0A7C8ICV8_9PLEO|nr:P-loop containing nucleoside triphosphate hydrolase protein [Massariosphaeria phaeospora]
MGLWESSAQSDQSETRHYNQSQAGAEVPPHDLGSLPHHLHPGSLSHPLHICRGENSINPPPPSHRSAHHGGADPGRRHRICCLLRARFVQPFPRTTDKGAPGAGKGTLCTHLASKHSLSHISVGDVLRSWMSTNKDTPLAARIRDKLDNQGFLTFQELQPFVGNAIEDAIAKEGSRGILIDGFPRSKEQAEAFREWSSREDSPLVRGELANKPDVVLSFLVSKENAKSRYLARARDNNDSAEKFEKRHVEYQEESPPVEELYRRSALLLEIDANGTKEENIEKLTTELEESQLWQKCIGN